MTATNHALTGALIGLTVGNPWLAVPLAFASHFVLDAIPHFGDSEMDEATWMRSRAFKLLLIGEAMLCLLLVTLLAFTRPQHWLVAAISAFVATSPDLFYMPRFISANRSHALPRINRFVRFHIYVQWSERRTGVITEAIWFLMVGYLVAARL